MISPTYIPVPGGVLYLAVYGPSGDGPCRGWILHVPAFAEEMNKARPMVNHQARLLAEQGYCVVVPDLYGTGDSSGDFGEADWSRWCDDITAILDWIRRSGGQSVCLWGLRLGCLLALEIARARPEQVRQLLLWQPVHSGRLFITQFLRLRMAAGLKDGKGESTGELRQLLERGSTVEVAGYDIAPELVAQLDQVGAMALAPPKETAVLWFEVASQEGKSLAPVSRKVVAAWQEAGVRVESQVVQGEPFWTTQEIAFAPNLLEATAVSLEDPPEMVVEPAICSLSKSSGAPDDGVVPIVFDCEGDELVGVLHTGAPAASRAVLLVVGGPQYRVGSHRQFVHLARALAEAGIPVLRFDYRGMGDSSGELVGFEGISPDITSALDALQHSLPSVEQVVIWGLCDAATAASFYAGSDDRVVGLVLLNPWVRSEEGEARAYLKHYYHKRLLSSAFWRKMLRGDFDFLGSLKSLGEHLRNAVSNDSGQLEICSVGVDPASDDFEDAPQTCSLVERVYTGLDSSRCQTLLIISGNDLTAAEFLDAVATRRPFRKLLKSKRFQRRDLAEADHTFSRRAWRDQISQWTVSWIKAL